MPGLVDLVAAISIEVNRSLVGVGLPPLTDGGILIGRVHIDETPAPPRIVMIPRSSRFEARESPGRSNVRPGAGLRSVIVQVPGHGYVAPTVTIDPPQLDSGDQATAVPILAAGSIRAIALTGAGSGYTTAPNVTITDASGAGAVAIARVGPTAAQLVQYAAKALFTDVVQFECHCWGIAAPAGYDQDFDAAQLLYQTLIASAYRVAPGMMMPTVGKWLDAEADAVQLDVAGHYYVLALEVRTPVLDAPLLYAPLGVQPTGTLSAAPPGGTPQPI